jgi:Protein of unknown function (DUF732)
MDELESTQAAELDGTAPAPSHGETQHIHAWADEDDLEPQHRSWKIPVSLAVLAAAAAVTTAVVTAWPRQEPLHVEAHAVLPAPAAAAPAVPAPSTTQAGNSYDDQFITDLSQQWGRPIPDRPQVIHDGLSVCSLLARGASKVSIEQSLVDKHILDAPDAAIFVNTSAQHYCP